MYIDMRHHDYCMMLVLFNLAPDTRVSFNFGDSIVSLTTHCHQPTCVRLKDRQSTGREPTESTVLVTIINLAASS